MNESAQVTEHMPECCSNGHPFGPRLVLVGWRPCPCVATGGGHRTYRCVVCDDVIFRPAHTE